jgi:hypothetical protein
MRKLFDKRRVEVTNLDMYQLRFYQLAGAVSFLVLVLVTTVMGIIGVVRAFWP